MTVDPEHLKRSIQDTMCLKSVVSFVLSCYFLDTIKRAVYPENIDGRLQYGTIR